MSDGEIRRKPPVVGQGSEARCWAAAMESWLRAQVADDGPRQGKFPSELNLIFGMPDDNGNRRTLGGFGWVRKSATVQELLDTYSDIVSSNGALIRGEALEQVAAESGMRWKYLDLLSFNKDQLFPLMSNGHLFIAYFAVTMYHGIVAYGFARDGVLAMDPRESGKLKTVTYDFLRDPARVNRQIFVGWPEKGAPLTIDHTVERYLPGEWHVWIGDWSGYFGFSDAGLVYWRTFDQPAAIRHMGKWKREGTSITWQFSDDDPAWMRTFRIQVGPDNTIPDRISSSATTPKGTTGYFTMTRIDDGR